MNINLRSSPEIVDIANEVIRNSNSFIQKFMKNTFIIDYIFLIEYY